MLFPGNATRRERRYSWAILGLSFLLLVGLVFAVWASQRLGGWKYIAYQVFTERPWPTYTQRISQLELLPVDSNDILLLGDSHIAYGQWEEWLPGFKTANRGVPGAGVNGMIDMIQPDSSSMWKPLPLNLEKLPMVVIQIGTNDLLFHPVDEVASRYRNLVRLVLEKRPNHSSKTLLLCSLPGVANEKRWSGLSPKQIESLNAEIQAIAEENGTQFFDLAAVLGSADGNLPEGLTDDGVHLRGEGYKIWSTGIIEYLVRGTTFASEHTPLGL